MRQHSDCIELSLGEDDERVESYCVRMKGQTNQGDTAVGVCCRTPDQEERVDVVLNRHFGSSLTVTGSGFCGGLYLLRHLLEEQHSKAQKVMEVLGKD